MFFLHIGAPERAWIEGRFSKNSGAVVCYFLPRFQVDDYFINVNHNFSFIWYIDNS